MKIDLIDEKIIIYLKDTFFKDDIKSATNDVKNIFIRLITYYHIKLSGLYDVYAYENKKYGTILEIIKKDDLFNSNIIDLKIKLFKNDKFYFKTKEYLILNQFNNIYYDNEYYYIDINNIDNIIKVIEYGDIIYNKKDNYLISKLLIK